MQEESLAELSNNQPLLQEVNSKTPAVQAGFDALDQAVSQQK
jgi:hypothetical protein